jgi:hypothetical protein
MKYSSSTLLNGNCVPVNGMIGRIDAVRQLPLGWAAALVETAE